eukprot:TRINITY_DN7101_c0_g1_i3.p1 TRINITY_DN7101_c0_g1~~TRINITY_DN7101_c0_g1_i3.p1  ORF type:complete len:1184 (+),score=255.46 TRINITY_DN7101_c0_g1_i3:407-3553(+)
MANLRHTNMTLSKLNAIDMLQELSAELQDAYKMDRLVPYLIFMCDKQHVATVRMAAVKALTSVVWSVQTVRKPDPALLAQFILPHLQAFVDPTTPLICRCAYAACLPFLATAGQRMIELSQNQGEEATTTADLDLLRNIVQSEHLNPLVMDTSTDVKQAFLNSRLDLLCQFLGPQRTTEVLLSHMMTFLNDKTSWRLRASFFSGAVHVANYVKGQSTVEFIMPLIERGLSDCEEYVVFRALKALLALRELDLLLPVSKRQLVDAIYPLLVHPNAWIQQTAIGLVASIGSTLSAYDLHCTWLPKLKPYLRYAITGLGDLSVLSMAVLPAIPRSLYEHIVQADNQDMIFDALAQEQLDADHMAEAQRDCMIALIKEGLTTELKQCVLRLQQHFRKMQSERHRLQELLRPGDAQLAPVVSPYRPQSNTNEQFVDLLKAEAPDVTKASMQRFKMDVEQNQPLSSKTLKQFDPLSTEISVAQEGESSLSVYRCDHDHLLLKQRLMVKAKRISKSYQDDTSATKRTSRQERKPAPVPAIRTWEPKGVLIANTAEHDARVTHLVTTYKNKFFLSASSDGIVKQWDLHTLSSQVGSNSAVSTLPKQPGPIADLVTSTVENTFSLACGNTITKMGLEGHNHLFQAKRQREVTALLSLQQTWMGWGELLLAADLTNDIIAYDTRIKQASVFSLHTPEAHGAVTAMTTSSDGCWFLSSTSRGCVTCWDIRFAKSAASWIASANSSIDQLHLYSSPVEAHQARPLPKVFAATDHNQWGLWDLSLSLRARYELLGASTNAQPPLKPIQNKDGGIPAPKPAHKFHAEIVRRELRTAEGGKAIDMEQAWKKLTSEQRAAFYELEHQDYVRYKAAVDEALNKLPLQSDILASTRPRTVACTVPGSALAFVGDQQSQIVALDLERPEHSYVMSSPRAGDTVFSPSYDHGLLIVRQASASSNGEHAKAHTTPAGPVAPEVRQDRRNGCLWSCIGKACVVLAFWSSENMAFQVSVQDLSLCMSRLTPMVVCLLQSAHRAEITALSVMKGVGYSLLSADAEGVIKVWQ